MPSLFLTTAIRSPMNRRSRSPWMCQVLCVHSHHSLNAFPRMMRATRNETLVITVIFRRFLRHRERDLSNMCNFTLLDLVSCATCTHRMYPRGQYYLGKVPVFDCNHSRLQAKPPAYNWWLSGQCAFQCGFASGGSLRWAASCFIRSPERLPLTTRPFPDASNLQAKVLSEP